MNQAEYKVWIGQLSSLSNEQTSELLTRVKLLSMTVQKPYDGKQEFGTRLVQAICDVLKKHNVECPSSTTLQKSTAYVISKPKFDDLMTFFEKISKSKIVQDQILREAIQLLYFDLVNWQGVAVSSHTILNQVHRIPSVLNRHFPGYASGGILCKIVNQG